jgi:hypothetical protein
MVHRNELRELSCTPEYIDKCVSEALSIFYDNCKKEDENGRRTCIAVAQTNKVTEIIPLVFRSIEDAEKVKKALLDSLAANNFQKYAVMVYKDGPFYHTRTKIGRNAKAQPYFFIKIKMSASW